MRKASSCALLEGEPAPYELWAHLWDGRDVQIDDPYRYGPQISESDLYLHSEGTLYEAWQTFGAHPVVSAGVAGVRFAVWAPNAETVSLAGEFNDWDTRRHPMRRAQRRCLGAVCSRARGGRFV